MVTFAGSGKVGAAIMVQGAPTLKKMHLELGGKSALFIRSDADLDRVLPSAMQFIIHAGQGFALATRHLVHESLHLAYVGMLGRALRSVRVDNPMDENVQMGPLIREMARRRTEPYVAEGLQRYRGVMTHAAHELLGFAKTRPGLDRPDSQIAIGLYSFGAVGTTARSDCVGAGHPVCLQ